MSLEYLPGTASLLEEIDKKLMVLLRDGRTLIGYLRLKLAKIFVSQWYKYKVFFFALRSVDQFANLVLHRCIERIHVGQEFGDIPRGVFVVRGENVVS
jgi:U6 snRNA-associated Sm-like protein LSm1